ncbi:general transcriptional corepressor trfA-like [Lucilia sericata]|uniref:general transcriptional corepressor trfA-like n=1 Tax=Lucilia sericata TaxID=13632 RepID=UPI0018A8636B|nr:general transcriptional corepressor trfA-like [Lucilia sericata]
MCLVCFRYHPFRYCRQFKKMTVKQRQYVCFARTHLVGGCIPMEACQECGDLHHTMLHPERSQRQRQQPQQRQRLQQQLQRRQQQPQQRQHQPQRRQQQQRRRSLPRQQMQSSRRRQQQP